MTRTARRWMGLVIIAANTAGYVYAGHTSLTEGEPRMGAALTAVLGICAGLLLRTEP